MKLSVIHYSTLQKQENTYGTNSSYDRCPASIWHPQPLLVFNTNKDFPNRYPRWKESTVAGD